MPAKPTYLITTRTRVEVNVIQSKRFQTEWALWYIFTQMATRHAPLELVVNYLFLFKRLWEPSYAPATLFPALQTVPVLSNTQNQT
jgi:hypothetical protein